MNPTDTIPVTLEAQAWNEVLRLLAKWPYRVSAPLISNIQGQCNQWDQVHSRDNVVPMNEAGE